MALPSRISAEKLAQLTPAEFAEWHLREIYKAYKRAIKTEGGSHTAAQKLLVQIQAASSDLERARAQELEVTDPKDDGAAAWEYLLNRFVPQMAELAPARLEELRRAIDEAIGEPLHVVGVAEKATA